MTTTDHSNTEWRKATASAGQGACVEIRSYGGGGAIAVRDSKHRDGPELLFTATEWAAFLTGVKAGEFDV